MHPIIKDFIYTEDKLSDIIEKHYDKENFLETTILKLFKSINYKEVDPQLYLDLDQAIVKGHSDTNVYLLFMFFIIRFMSFRKQLERANVILSIGNSLKSEDIHPIVQSLFINSAATLRSFENNWPECNRLMKESVALFDKSNPRYVSLLLGTATLLSQQGKLKDLDQEDLDRLNNITHEQLAFTGVGARLVNNILTCNYSGALNIFPEYKRLYRGDISTSVNIMQDLLKMLSGDFDEKNYLETESKIYVKVLRSLMMGNLDEAVKDFQAFKAIDSKFLKSHRYAEYLPLNMELCLKNKGKARLLFLEKKERSGSDILEDFFLARIQLLEKDQVGALASFHRLMDTLNRYDAMNLLAFELQFAMELKPADILTLMDGIDEQLVLKTQKSKQATIAIPHNQNIGLELLVGNSPAIKQAKELVKKFSQLKEPVLITGETGTGKELAARAIHEECPHSKEPFLAINCGALTESLLQSELFGYVAGAFTGAQKERLGIFEAAGSGTVFLDEFGDISPQLQVSLLRVLESNEIRLIGGNKTRQIQCKIIIATNIDLHQAVEMKKFREDLYFRLTRFDIKLPPLRERKEDIPKLIDYFLSLNKGVNEKIQRLSKELLEVLVNYKWSGNIRELKNEIERLKILHADSEVLNLEDFDFKRLQGMASFISTKEDTVIEKKINPANEKNEDVVLDHEKILMIVQRGTKAENRHKVITDLFQTYKKLSRSHIVQITGMNPGLASKELQTLCSAGFIRKITPTKSVKSHYFVLS